MAQAGGPPQASTTSGQPYVSKLVLLGSSSVGKTSLALRYMKQDFSSVLPTVGCAFFTKVVDAGSSSLKLEIWDTAGQEKYHSVCHLYFRGANAALLVYDITRKDSFHKAQQWLEDLEKEFQPGEVVVMLVGNKTDLDEEREVTFQVPHGGRQQEGALVSVDLRAFETLKHTHMHMHSHMHTHTHTHPVLHVLMYPPTYLHLHAHP